MFINADDFCLSSDINHAIIELSNLSKIDSTSVVVTNKDISVEENIKLLNDINVGLHLNLCEGRPISETKKVNSLVNRKGEFYSLKILWIRYIFGKVRKEEIFLEISNQYNELAKYIRVSHVDSHKHIHCFPFLGEYILDCLLRLRIERIRNPYPLFYKQKKYIFIKLFCKRKKWNKIANNFVKSLGIVSIHKIDDIQSILLKYKNDNVEIIIHPSRKNEGGYLNNYKEYSLLRNL